MAKLDLIIEPDPRYNRISDRLRQKVEPVSEVTDDLRNLAESMFETMVEEQGVGLAAPQIGEGVRLIVANIPAGYDDDIDKARDILERIVTEHELVLKEPEPVIKVNELADSSVNLICRPWVQTADYWPVYWELTRAVKERFDAEGISIPFPQRDVHLHQALPPAGAVVD